MYQQISLFTDMEDLTPSDFYEEVDEFDEEQEDEGIVSIGRKIDFDRSERRIRDLHNDYQVGDLDPSPFFQRGYVWNLKRASLLIESILLNVPIPLIYTAEEEESGVELVIDGQQRLTSLFRFLANEYPLTGLKVFKNLNGSHYRDLDKQFQRKLDRYQLSVVKVSSDSDEEVKFEIFERINSGSVNLNDQEIRNCIYRGHYIELLKECAKESLLIELAFISFLPKKVRSQATIKSATPKRMENVEIVLRYFTFYKEGLAPYKGRLKPFLNEHLKKMTKMYAPNSMSESERDKDFEQLKKTFRKSLELAKLVFGSEIIFRTCYLEKKPPHNLEWGDKRNMALLEIVLWGFTLYEKSQVVPKADAIREAMIALMINNPNFIAKEAIYRPDNLRNRFDIWSRELREIIDSPKQPRTFSYKLKEELFDSDPTCKICGQKIRSIDDSEVDHNIPYWKGGATILKNARLAHRFCNRNKGGKPGTD